MVAKITTPASITRALNYNEKKVAQGHAACIGAAGFLLGVKDLNFYAKLNRFKDLIALNTRAKTNTLHISLNFDPRERFSKEKLLDIAFDYMTRIGFGDQPFLVYEHYDAAHPHVHIVTTTIREDGKRIDTFNIGRNQSEKARKEIEDAYGLVRATRKKEQEDQHHHPVQVQMARYGVSETKRSITSVLNLVVNQYKFTSLPELNAVLKMYNVLADRGQEDSRIYRNGGLQYRLLDNQGNKVGVPIKSSSIYFKPTLKFLEQKFAENEVLRQPLKRKLKIAIDWTLAKKPDNIRHFALLLKKENVTAILRENKEGYVYGITFVDHRNKTVFNGSALGKMYSVAGIRERMGAEMHEQKAGVTTVEGNLHEFTEKAVEQNENVNYTRDVQDEQQHRQEAASDKENLWELLMKKEKHEFGIPFELKRQKKKRRIPKL